jgi:type I restriction enzyme S subunit
MIRLNTKIVTPEYFIYWMNYLYETRIIDKFQLQSTGIINFKFEYFLRKGDVLLPSMEVMREFSIKIQDLRKQIDKLSEINDNLVKQRDMLLPRLLSGKLEV